MGSIFAIAKYTIVEQIRNRLYLIILFFGAAILIASLLLGSLAPGHKVRVIFDLGLVAIELFGLATAVFGAVSLILQEIESKTIYLLMTRPLPRPYYLLGRFLGLVVAVALTMMIMAVMHVMVMCTDLFSFREFTYGTSFGLIYPSLVMTSIAKMLVTTSVAMFFSLFATSSVSALVFTAFFWVAGHFGQEIFFLINRSSKGAMQVVMHVVASILPNFQYLNFRDTYAIPHFPGLQFFLWALLYTIGYASFFLALSATLFSKKEF
jgi:ABC-type transport system involved in multi-copper enzyme maturation permease subunit